MSKILFGHSVVASDAPGAGNNAFSSWLNNNSGDIAIVMVQFAGTVDSIVDVALASSVDGGGTVYPKALVRGVTIAAGNWEAYELLVPAGWSVNLRFRTAQSTGVVGMLALSLED